MKKMNYGEAIRSALRCALSADERVYIFGEDVASYGGVYGITKGLHEEFGGMRVRNTPLSEIAILGEAIGSAIAGMRPIAEIQFSDFITTAFTMLVDVAAPYKFRTGTPVPILVRAPMGGGLRVGPYHSRCPESWFYNVPGLKIVTPATPHDVKGLLQSSLEDEDPVLFFEHKKLYYEISEEIPEDLYRVPLGKGIVRRTGKDLTIVTYSAMVHLALAVSETLSKEGVEIEVLDLRTLVPLDRDLILHSVSKTGRVLILHESPIRGGVGGEIESIICENIFGDLKSPPRRVGAEMTPIPMPPQLEDACLPTAEKVLRVIRNLIGA